MRECLHEFRTRRGRELRRLAIERTVFGDDTPDAAQIISLVEVALFDLLCQPRHHEDDVLDDAVVSIGYLWIGPDTSGNAGAWWIWDIVIDADKRGRGFGRRAMVLGEEYAQAHGAHTLGLSVFGFNKGARGLYESLGYETTSVKMLKKIG